MAAAMVISRTMRSLGRLGDITAVVARHGLSHFQERRRAKQGGEEPPADVNIPASARRFRAILEELGPTFIKFGQVLSTRPDLLPPGFAEALRGLQDDCPAMPTTEARAAIETSLGKPISVLFATFEDVPLASASIAQVHRAVLPSGEKVVIKVQRPGIRDRIVRDLDLLRYLAQLVESIVEEAGLVTPRGIVDEFESAFLGELDFSREAKTMRRFADNLEGKQRTYVVPKVYEHLSSRTVLTMELIEGARLSDLGPRHDKKKIAANIVAASFEQIFTDGLFHADPHPGNAFILDDNRLGLIDFGSVGQISYAMRETLLVLVVAVATRDAETVARLLYRVGIPDERVSLHRLRDACASLFDEYLRDRVAVANVDATRLLAELFQLAARFRVRIPSEYALIGRAAATVEGIIRQLDPDLEVLETAKPFVKRLIEEQFSVPSLQEGTMKNLLRARSVLRELPLTASQILMDLETGKLSFKVENPELAKISKAINVLGVAVFTGLVAGGLVSGSMFILAQYRLELWGWPVVPILSLYVASLLFGGALGYYFLAPRLRRLSLTRLLGRLRPRE